MLVRRAWKAIYDGNVKDHEERARIFVQKYAQRIPNMHDFKVGPITAEDVRAGCTECAHTAAGPVSWEPAEMALWSMEAYGKLADLMNMIEEGAPWPDRTTLARAAFLQKDPARTQNPVDYMALRILSALYRRWASVRLAAMRPWTGKWSDKSTGAGAEAAGATDSSYRVTLETELARARGEDICGGTIDIQTNVRPTPPHIAIPPSTDDGDAAQYPRCIHEVPGNGGN